MRPVCEQVTSTFCLRTSGATQSCRYPPLCPNSRLSGTMQILLHVHTSKVILFLSRQFLQTYAVSNTISKHLPQKKEANQNKMFYGILPTLFPCEHTHHRVWLVRLGEGEEQSTLRKYLFIGHSGITSGAFSDDEYVPILNAKKVCLIQGFVMGGTNVHKVHICKGET